MTTSFTSLANTRPDTADWTDDLKQEYESKMLALSIPKELVIPYLEESYKLCSDIDKLVSSGRKTRQRLSLIIDEVARQGVVDQDEVDAVALAVKTYNNTYNALKARVDTHLISQEQVQESIKKRVEEQSGTRNWSDILALLQQSDELFQDIVKARRAKEVKVKYEQATKDIDRAVMDVFNDKFNSMSSEIVGWWSTLRPDELTQFDGVSMRGSGKRYFDLKAIMRTVDGAEGVKKDAVSIFSDSQLNALGLAAFLARCSIQGAPFMLLDDPIPSGDEEHRLSFAMTTMDKIFSGNVQVVVTVFDTTIAQQLKDYHKHRDLKYYEVQLVSPIIGSKVKNVGDEFHNAVATGKTLMVNPDTESRRTAGQNFRRATERLAKMVIVSGVRALGKSASIADYEGKTIGELQPLVAPYGTTPEEPGTWSVLARELNRSDHDDNPPTTIALKNCHSALRKIESSHPEVKGFREI